MVFGLTACSASLPDFSTTNISMLGGFTKEEEKADAGYEVVLAKQAAALWTEASEKYGGDLDQLEVARLWEDGSEVVLKNPKD